MIVSTIDSCDRYFKILPDIKQIVEFIREDRAVGHYELKNGCSVNVAEGTTSFYESVKFEAHKKYIDVHYLVSGKESIEWVPTKKDIVLEQYDEKTEAALYEDMGILFDSKPGMLYIVFPEDAHKPCVHENIETKYKKMIFKIPIDNCVIN